jgi:hypothetical protein
MNQDSGESPGSDSGLSDQLVPLTGPAIPGGAQLTIYDVARAAGVAPSTVSRALWKPGRVSYKTAERVRRVAEELGYRIAVSSHKAASDGRSG